MQYTIRPVSKDFATVKALLSKNKLEKGSLYEVLFGRLKGRSAVTVSIPIPSNIKKEKLQLFFIDRKDELIKIDCSILGNDLIFSTNKLGMYLLSQSEEHHFSSSNTTMSKTRYEYRG